MTSRSGPARWLVLLALCLAVIALPAVAHAADKYVALTGSDGAAGSFADPYRTVQRGINMAAAGGGGTVFVGPGVFKENPTLSPHVSLRGAGAYLTTLDGNGSGRVIRAAGLSSGETISGFTITGGKTPASDDGGGIYCDVSPSMTIRDNRIVGNAADRSGGGICCTQSSPLITGNVIAGNEATGSGGGIHCGPAANPVITNNAITDNSTAGSGGGICTFSGAPTISGNTLAGNTAVTVGGGIYTTGMAVITRNTIAGNRVRDDGGGICSNSSTPTIEGNTISGNWAGTRGGGIRSYPTANPQVTNNEIVGNSGGNYGGGIFIYGGNVRHDTIVGNSALQGGGIYRNPGGTATVTNCILWYNTSDLYNCITTYCDLEDGDTSITNISENPLFVAPASGNYRLSAGSPCIDEASPTVAPATDKDGIGRPWGIGYDMGAYEYYAPSFATTTRLSGPSSVKVRKTLKLTGTVAAAGSPYTPPGKVLITKQRKVGRKWKSAGSARVTLVNGAFSYSFKPKYKGRWRFKASYSGGVQGPTSYRPSKSAFKGVKVK